MRIIPFLAMAALLPGACSKQAKIEYPSAPNDSTSYEAFGMTVNDPYRPLENDTAAATLAWVEAENKVTQDYLSQIPFRNDIHRRLETLNRFGRQGLPTKRERRQILLLCQRRQQESERTIPSRQLRRYSRGIPRPQHT